MAGSFSTLKISLFQRSNKGVGVLPEATKAYQFSASNPAYPDSATVGMWGK